MLQNRTCNDASVTHSSNDAALARDAGGVKVLVVGVKRRIESVQANVLGLMGIDVG